MHFEIVDISAIIYNMNARRTNKEKNKYPHALTAALLTMVMYVFFVIGCRIAPFGDDTFLVYDMKRQYVDFYSYFKSMLAGENDMFYSWAIAMGTGAVGFFTYYLSSPLLFIVGLFDRENLTSAITLLIGIKLMLTSASCDIFLASYVNREKKEKDSKNRPHTLIFSLSYTFSAFVVSNSINPMWIDIFALMPLTIFFLDKLIFEKKKSGYMICLALMLWCNYYMTFMVCIFIVIWTLYRLVSDKEDALIKLLRVGICSFWAACLVGVVLIPTALDLMGSPKDIFELGLETTKGNLSIRDVLIKMWIMAYNRRQTIFGTPLIYIGILSIFLVILYFLNNTIKKKEKICMLVIFAIFWVSFLFDKINLVWHAGMEPSGYPYREAFLYILVCLMCACRCFNNPKGIDIKRVMIAGVLTGSAFAYSLTGKYEFADKRFAVTNTVLIVIIFLLLLLLVFVSTGGRFKRTEYTEKISSMIIATLVIIQIAELVINARYIYGHQTSMNMLGQKEYERIVSETSKAVDYAKRDLGFYRIENMKSREQNDDMMYNYNGITHYSSAGILDTRYFLQNIGFNDDGLYTDFGHDNTCAADSLLGIRYLVGADEYRKTYEKVYDGEYSLYKNPYSLPVATLVSQMPGELTGSPFEMQQEMLDNLSDTQGEVFTNAIMWSQVFSDDNGAYKYFMCKPKYDGNVYLYLDHIEELTQNLVIYVGDEPVSGYGNKSSMKIVNLGYHEKDKVFDVYVRSDSKIADFGEAHIMTENMDELKLAYEQIKDRGCEIKKLESSRLEISVPNEVLNGENKGVITTIPYEKGWKVTVNKKRVECEKVYDSFMFIPLAGIEDAQVIEMKYIPEGMREGVFISFIAIAGIVLWEIIERRKNHV